MTDPAQMSMQSAVKEAGKLLDMFKSVRRLAEVIEVANRAEHVLKHGQKKVDELEAAAMKFAADVEKSQAEAIAIAAANDEAIQKSASDVAAIIADAKSDAAGMVAAAQKLAGDKLAEADAHVLKREKQAEALTERIDAMTAEVTSLEARITKARGTLRKLADI
jgi:prefoldin subunit 5